MGLTVEDGQEVPVAAVVEVEPQVGPEGEAIQKTHVSVGVTYRAVALALVVGVKDGSDGVARIAEGTAVLPKLPAESRGERDRIGPVGATEHADPRGHVVGGVVHQGKVVTHREPVLDLAGAVEAHRDPVETRPLDDALLLKVVRTQVKGAAVAAATLNPNCRL